MKRSIVIPTILCLAIVPVSLGAAVIRVPGDQPTIQEGVNAASEGDTVLVSAGTYTGPMNRDIDFGGTNLVLLSEAGPELTVIHCEDAGRGLCFRGGEDPTSIVDGFTVMEGFHKDGGAVYCKGSSPTIRNCVFTRNASTGVGGAMACHSASPVIVDCIFTINSSELAVNGVGGAIFCASGSALVIDGCVFSHSGSDMGGAIACEDGSSLLLTYCLLFENAADTAGALACRSGSTCVVERCTVAGSIGCGASAIYCGDGCSVAVETTIIAYGCKGPAVGCHSGGSAVLACCDVFGNEYGDWVGCIAGQNGINGNISEDPLFCGPLNPDERYSLHSDSPCAFENSPECGGMGALDVGCGVSPVDATSWGCLKALFRQQ